MAGLYPGAALTATLLAAHGFRKGSLSGSGAVTAWLVGYGHLANPLKLFGVTMIVFYLIGSRATKVKAAQKAKLEDGPDPSKPGGHRNWAQVLSSSAPSLVAALVYRVAVSHRVGAQFHSVPQHPLARPLIFAALGHFSNTLADTLASELGILSTSPPRFILNGHVVPPGTNGGVSVLGLIASVVGGALMGLTMILDLIIESEAARSALGSGWVGEMLLFSTLAGLAGSLLDSLLGATLQRTLLRTSDMRILTDHSAREARAAGQALKQIGPGLDILSNSGVNMICGFTLAAIGYWYGGGSL